MSGRLGELLVRESCFIFSCQHEVEQEGFLWNRRLGSLDVGDAEHVVFPKATMHWSADETEVRWETRTRHGLRNGTIHLQ